MTHCNSSKERDRETGLSDHGARLYDAQVAGWMSVDAARQFANLFSYGVNPLNGVDLDGNRNTIYIVHKSSIPLPTDYMEKLQIKIDKQNFRVKVNAELIDIEKSNSFDVWRDGSDALVTVEDFPNSINEQKIGLAEYGSDKGRIAGNRLGSETWLWVTTTLHEWGHGFGDLRHEEGETIMAPFVGHPDENFSPGQIEILDMSLESEKDICEGNECLIN